MTDHPNAAELAGRLVKSTRTELVKVERDDPKPTELLGLMSSEWKDLYRTVWPKRAQDYVNAVRRLKREGMAENAIGSNRCVWRLTPLGLAVRAHLLKDQSA